MKISAYFFDKYTTESIWIAGILWPLYFIPFYFFYKRDNNINRSIGFPIVASLLMASFTCLVFADSLIEYVTFFTGLGLLLFGSMAMCMNGKNVVWYTGLGVIITIIASIILYFMRTRVYGRKSIPSTKGETKTLWTPGAWIWILIQLLLYVYVFYVILKQSYN
jgi:hypothetical protein